MSAQYVLYHPLWCVCLYVGPDIVSAISTLTLQEKTLPEWSETIRIGTVLCHSTHEVTDSEFIFTYHPVPLDSQYYIDD